MEQLNHLKSRIASVSELLDVISALRSLASIRTQQARQSLPATRQYATVVGEAISEALSLTEARQASPEEATDGSREAVLVFGAEHGFVGGLNRLILDAFDKMIGEEANVFVIGRKCLSVAEERGTSVAWSLPMASHLEGVIAVARRIAAELYSRFAGREFTCLTMLFARCTDGSSWTIERQSLLPVDLALFMHQITAAPPLHNLPSDLLLEELTEEYFLAELTGGVMEALASENAARLAAMRAAYENVQQKLADLTLLEHRLRQEEITTELLDIVSGAEAFLYDS